MRPSLRCLSAAAAAAATRRNTLGFIGLGAMGREMASNLLTKTFAAKKKDDPPLAFVVHDNFPKPVTTFLESHASAVPGSQIMQASSPAGVARLASTIITMLPSSPQVEDVYLDPEVGILPTLKDLSPEDRTSTLCVDCTTLDQVVARDVARQVNGTGASMLDAPVSGGVVGAREATLSFMCGGHPEAFARAEAFLALMGRRSIYCGQSGNGLAAKLANNLLLGVSMIGTAEAMLLGIRLGLAPDLLAGILNTSTGKCWSSEVNNPAPGALAGTGKSPPADRNWQGGFLSKLMSKDLGLASNAAADAGLALPMSGLADRIYQKLAADADFSDRDFSVILQWLEVGNRGLQGGATEAAEEIQPK